MISYTGLLSDYSRRRYIMRKTLKTIVTIVLSAAMLAGLSACGSSAPDSSTGSKGSVKKITVSLDWTPNTNHTGMYVAQALGYYKEAGLEVEIVQPPEDGAVSMCAAGQAQFAIDAQDTTAGALDSDTPMEVTTVAALIQHNTSGIISRKGDGINHPSGLEGKRYSTWNLPVELATLEQVVKDDGGDFSKVELIPNTITDEPAALREKQTDAVWVFYGWSGINAEVEGVEVDYWNFRDINPVFDYYTPTMIANNDFLANDPETAKAFLEATKKGYEYAVDHPKEAADYLIKGDSTGSLKDSADLVYKSQEYLSPLYIDDADRWGVIDEGRWNAFYSWLYENKLTKNDLTGTGFSNDYLPQ